MTFGAEHWPELMPHHLRPSSFPPSFEGNPWAYAIALFSLILVVSLSAAQILKHVAEAGREKAIARKLGLYIPARPVPFWTALSLYRWKVSCLYMTIIFGAIGDVAVLLSWREVTARTMELLLQVDRLLDGATIIPFIMAFSLAAWSEQALPNQLSYPEPRPVKPPKWERVKGSVRIVAFVAAISMGVTLGKAWM